MCRLFGPFPRHCAFRGQTLPDSSGVWRDIWPLVSGCAARGLMRAALHHENNTGGPDEFIRVHPSGRICPATLLDQDRTGSGCLAAAIDHQRPRVGNSGMVCDQRSFHFAGPKEVSTVQHSGPAGAKVVGDGYWSGTAGASVGDRPTGVSSCLSSACWSADSATGLGVSDRCRMNSGVVP